MLNKFLLYIVFSIISFFQLKNSHDFEQYVLQIEQLENLRSFGPLSSYSLFLEYIILFLENAEYFVFLLWFFNWFSIFLLITNKKFNFWFLLNYLILFSYLWHSNQLRQGIIMPIFILYYFKVLNNEINYKKFSIIAFFLSIWHLASLALYSFFIKIKLHYLIIPALIFSAYMGGQNTLLNLSSVSVLLLILVSLKKKSSSTNLIVFFYIIFLVFRPFSPVISSRMLELSLLSIPFLFINKCSINYKISFTFLSIIIMLNNINYF